MRNINKQMTINEVGRLGGLTVLAQRGRDYFSEIGRKGQQVMRKRYPGMASVWGKRGGRPRKN